jgi:hypothetical protein
MRIAKLFSLLLSLNTVGLLAQIPAITGWIYNKKTLETIPGAILIDSTTNASVESNDHGYYQFGTTRGNKIIIVAAAGFKTQKIEIEVEASVNKNFFLKPIGYNELDSAEQYLALFNMKPSFYSPTQKQIIESPSIGSVADPVKYLQFLPGVSGGVEGLSGLVVRGSNPDQNLQLMNGLPLYGNGHLFGFVSNYNPHILKSVHFYRGVAPARYGGRAGGGVLDIQTSGGAAKDWTGKIHADPATFTMAMDGPLDHRGKVTSSISVRRSYLDWIIGAGSQSNSGLIGNIHDINARVDYKKNQYTQWNFWAYNGRDKYGVSFSVDETDSLGRRLVYTLKNLTSWQNTQIGARWSHEFYSNHFGSVTMGLSRYKYYTNFDLDGSITQGGNTKTAKLSEKSSNSIADYTINGDFTYVRNPRQTINYGSQITLHHLEPGQLRLVDQTNTGNIDTAYGMANVQTNLEWANYAELEVHPNIGLSMNLGVRLWTFITPTKTYCRPEPRIIISQLLEGKKRLQLGYSVSNQGLHQLSSVNGVLPSDVWFPSSATFKPQKTSQFTAAYIMPVSAGLEFSTEFYYKKYNGITDLTGIDEDPLVKNFWERSVVQGEGDSKGIEFLLSKKSGKITGLTSYTYSQSNRTFEFINNGEEFRYRWDRPHQFKAQLTFQIETWFKINFAAMYMSGNVYSVPTGQYITTDNKLVYDYSEKNNYRMPAYRRIDLGFTKQIKPFYNRGYKEFWGVQVYNILGVKNPMNAKLSIDPNTNNVVLKGTAAFVFVPSGFYRIEF